VTRTAPITSAARLYHSRSRRAGMPPVSEDAGVAVNREDRRSEASPPPAPRGSSPDQPPRPSFRPNGRWILFALAVLAINVYVGTRSTQPSARTRIPYSPFFLEQVQAGRVKEITSKGTAIQGTFTEPLGYLESKPSTRFQTEIPTFADTDALSRLLQ